MSAYERADIRSLSFPSFISSNCRSLFGKVPELKQLLSSKLFLNLCCVALQETWLNKSVESCVMSLGNDFSFFRCDRAGHTKSRGGGVATYISSKWCSNPKIFFSYAANGIECLAIRCRPKFLPNFRSVVLINLYVAPDVSRVNFNNFVDSLSLNCLGQCDNDVICLAGDLNKVSLAPFRLFGLSDVISFPTRAQAQLDHVLINFPNFFHVNRLPPLSSSDHCVLHLRPVVCSRSCRRQILATRLRRIKKRNNASENLARLRSMIETTDFAVFYDENPATELEAISSYLSFCYNLCCPLDVIFVGSNRMSSPSLKRLRRAKEFLYRNHLRTFYSFINTLIKAEVSRIYSLHHSSIQISSSKEVWSNIKSVFAVPSLPSPNLDVENLNLSFVSPFLHSSPQVCFPTDSPAIPEFSPSEVMSAFKALKPSAAGPDGLPSIVLKTCSYELCHYFCNIFSRSVNSSLFPDQWRIARIVAVPKKDSTKFRPIACTSSLLKFLEYLILFRIRPFLLPVSDPLQFGFKPSNSTLDPVAALVHLACSSLDKGKCVFKCFSLDFSSAFNSVSRDVLLVKLSELGIPSRYLSWLHSYFSNRRQFTQVGPLISSTIPCNSGLLQGAVLSPALFSFYTDECKSRDSTLLKYADDFLFCSPVASPADSANFLGSFEALRSEFPRLNLSLNSSKCHEVSFHARCLRSARYADLCSPASLDFCSVSCFTYLGVKLSDTLSWSSHVEGISLKIIRLSHYVRRLRSLEFPQTVILTFIRSCVIPLITYCSPAIFPGLNKLDFSVLRHSIRLLCMVGRISYKSIIDRIVSLHFNSCDRFITHIFRTPSHPLHDILNSCTALSSTRRQHRHIYARTSLYKNSVVPYLARFLTSPTVPLADLYSSFDCNV